MKYIYVYRSSDGIRHEAEMDAASREEVFASLRERGIRAIKVIAADGSKANGEIRGVRKRVVLVFVLAAIVLTVAVTLVGTAFHRGPQSSNGGLGQTALPDRAPRHQIYGDPALMQQLYETGFEEVFADPLDRYIAGYAQPGIAPDAAIIARLKPEVLAMVGRFAPNRRGSLGDRPLPAGSSTRALPNQTISNLESNNSSREIAELIRIVNGMRDELAAFLADGSSLADYLDSLEERLAEEQRIYNQVVEELAEETDETVREAKNAALRAAGLKTVPRPKKEK